MREVKEGSNTKFSALYAGDGERVSKTDDTTGSHLFSFGLHDTGDGGTLYTPGLSQRRGATDRFFHHDWLGSTRYLTDSTGTTTPTALRFNAFGKTTAQAGPDNPTPFGFAGAWGYETEGQNHLELQYLYQRYYDPQVGRFISRDPIRWAGGLNLYNYCDNDTVNAVDPLGLRMQIMGSKAFKDYVFDLVMRIHDRGPTGRRLVREIWKSPRLILIKQDDAIRSYGAMRAETLVKKYDTPCDTTIPFSQFVPRGVIDGATTTPLIAFGHELAHAWSNQRFGTKSMGDLEGRERQEIFASVIENRLREENRKPENLGNNWYRRRYGLWAVPRYESGSGKWDLSRRGGDIFLVNFMLSIFEGLSK